MKAYFFVPITFFVIAYFNFIMSVFTGLLSMYSLNNTADKRLVLLLWNIDIYLHSTEYWFLMFYEFYTESDPTLEIVLLMICFIKYVTISSGLNLQVAIELVFILFELAIQGMVLITFNDSIQKTDSE